jgi:hypothetical protein
MTYFKTCNICLNNCYFPCSLSLDCSCKFDVHYKCYYKWWKENESCIICRKHTSDPFLYAKKNMDIRELNVLSIIIGMVLVFIWFVVMG